MTDMLIRRGILNIDFMYWKEEHNNCPAGLVQKSGQHIILLPPPLSHVPLAGPSAAFTVLVKRIVIFFAEISDVTIGLYLYIKLYHEEGALYE